MEAGSNDGYLLQWYRKMGIDVLGIEPAEKIAKIAIEQRGYPLFRVFRGGSAHTLLLQGRRAILPAHNVLAHVPDQNGFIEGISLLLKEDGVAIIEAPYVVDMIEHLEFDTIYHEHICYFSLTALVHVFARHRMKIIDVERVKIHRGDRCESPRLANRPRVEPVGSRASPGRGAEGRGRSDHFYQDFARRVDELRDSLFKMLEDLERRPSPGGDWASAKGAHAALLLRDRRRITGLCRRSQSRQAGDPCPVAIYPSEIPNRLFTKCPRTPFC